MVGDDTGGQPGHDPAQVPGYADPFLPPPAGHQQPYGYGYAQPPGPPTTEGFAIAALVLGILGGVLLALIFGFVALSRIKRSQGAKKGRGLAIAGIVLAGVWTLVFAGGIVAVLTSPQFRAATTGGATDGGRVSASDVGVGDCLSQIPGHGDVQFADVVPCTEPHHVEAFARFDLPDGDYPGASAASAAAEDGCSERVPDNLDKSVSDDLSLFFFYPTKAKWALGDRKVLCMATSTQAMTRPIAP